MNLARSARLLERLAEADTVVFDKTGTRRQTELVKLMLTSPAVMRGGDPS